MKVKDANKSDENLCPPSTPHPLAQAYKLKIKVADRSGSGSESESGNWK